MFGVDRRAAKYTFTVALVLLLLYAVFIIRGTLFVLTVSLLFAYLLYPLVDFVNRYMPSRSRTPALALVYLILVGILVTLGITIGSRAAEEASALSERAPALIDQMRQAPPATFTPDRLQSLRETVFGAVHNYVYKHNNEIVSFLPGLSLQILKASRNLIYLVIVPIISFFILKDGRLIRDDLLSLINPGPSRVLADEILFDLHTLLLQFMRALFTLCAITLVTFAIVLNTMGVPYAILLASVAFPLEFIPMIGPLFAAIAIISVTIFSGYPHLIWVVVFLGVYRLVQDYVISPRLMSAGIRLHPLLVIIGVFAGEEMAGVRGAFLSVPVIALLRVLYHRIRISRVSATTVIPAA
jgi:predicted PurR-regulated permease PerM